MRQWSSVGWQTSTQCDAVDQSRSIQKMRPLNPRAGGADIVFSQPKGASMPIDPNAIGAKTDPHVFEWTDRDTLLYALGVGAGTDDLAFTTENSHEIPQQVLPTYAVIACTGFAAAGKIGSFNFAMLLHGSQQIRLFKPLPPAGKLSVVAEVADIQDKG